MESGCRVGANKIGSVEQTRQLPTRNFEPCAPASLHGVQSVPRQPYQTLHAYVFGCGVVAAESCQVDAVDTV